MKTTYTVAIAVVLASIGAYLYLNRGLMVVVKNVGPEALHSVVVHTTGNSYAVGEIDSGQIKKIKIAANGNSHVELERANGPRLIVNCYFGDGNKGNIWIHVEGGKLIQQECNIAKHF